MDVLKKGINDFDERGLETQVLYINRVAKVLAGGRRFRFTALVAVGDRNGRVGLALGKASEVVDAIRKGEELAKKSMINVVRKGTTIPHPVKVHFCASTIVLRPAREGSGITAGGPARSILALAGISDCTAKYLGSSNRINCARAAFEALKKLEDPQEVVYIRKNFAEWKAKQAKKLEPELRVASALAMEGEMPVREAEVRIPSEELEQGQIPKIQDLPTYGGIQPGADDDAPSRRTSHGSAEEDEYSEEEEE